MHSQHFNTDKLNSKAYTNVLSVGYPFLAGKFVNVTQLFFKNFRTEKQINEGLEYG